MADEQKKASGLTPKQSIDREKLKRELRGLDPTDTEAKTRIYNDLVGGKYDVPLDAYGQLTRALKPQKKTYRRVRMVGTGPNLAFARALNQFSPEDKFLRALLSLGLK